MLGLTLNVSRLPGCATKGVRAGMIVDRKMSLYFFESFWGYCFTREGMISEPDVIRR